MNSEESFSIQVCDTRLEVTVLRHDMNHASQQQIVIQKGYLFVIWVMSPEIQRLNEKRREKMFI